MHDITECECLTTISFTVTIVMFFVRSYWNKPEATIDSFEEGWLKTGDTAGKYI